MRADSALAHAARFRAMETGVAAPASPKSATKHIAGAWTHSSMHFCWAFIIIPHCSDAFLPPLVCRCAAKFRALEAGGAPVPRPAAVAPKPAAPAPPPKKAPGVVLGGAADRCPRCSKAVYAAEKVLGPGGDWHRACLRCAVCARGLAAAAWSEHKGDAFCKACHEKEFGPKGVRGGAGGGMMHA
jgi:hypothetical protein